jgi:hypothetical protein
MNYVSIVLAKDLLHGYRNFLPHEFCHWIAGKWLVCRCWILLQQ